MNSLLIQGVWLETQLVLIDLIESLVGLARIQLLIHVILRRPTVWTSCSRVHVEVTG